MRSRRTVTRREMLCEISVEPRRARRGARAWSSQPRASRDSRAVCVRVCGAVCACVAAGARRARAPLARPSRPLRDHCLSPLSSCVCVHMCVDAGLCLYILYNRFLHPAACQPRVCARVYVYVSYVCVCVACARERRVWSLSHILLWSLSRFFFVFAKVVFILRKQKPQCPQAKVVY